MFRFLYALLRPFVIGNTVFSLWLARAMSWSIWPLLIIIGSSIGLAFRQEDAVMLMLTIQTSIDAAATKMLQNQVNESDARRDAKMDEQLETIEAMLVEMKLQNDAALKRDQLAAKRDKMIITALEARNELLLIRATGVSNVTGTTRRGASGHRKTHGRANPRKPKT